MTIIGGHIKGWERRRIKEKLVGFLIRGDVQEWTKASIDLFIYNIAYMETLNYSKPRQIWRGILGKPISQRRINPMKIDHRDYTDVSHKKISLEDFKEHFKGELTDDGFYKNSKDKES